MLFYCLEVPPLICSYQTIHFQLRRPNQLLVLVVVVVVVVVLVVVLLAVSSVLLLVVFLSYYVPYTVCCIELLLLYFLCYTANLLQSQERSKRPAGRLLFIFTFFM